MRGSWHGNGGSRIRLRRVPRRAPVAASVLAAGVALTLAACGNLSLIGSLHRESPGELRFSPSTVAIPLETPATLTATGGISPYHLVSGAVNPLDDHTWEFPAQLSIIGDWQDFPVQVSDAAGKTATAVVRVYAVGPVLNVTAVTLLESVGWTFTVTGGLPPYAWEQDGMSKGAGTSYPFFSADQGSYTVAVFDSLSYSQAATVEVVPSGIGIDPLSITPGRAVMVPGGRVAFTALGGDGNYTFSAPDGGTVDSANPATYVAPGAVGAYAVSVADGSGGLAVSAEVIVTATGTLPVLFPGSLTISAVDTEVQFSASGGTPPYAYSSGKPAIGSIDLETGLYRQLAEGNVLLKVEDAAGLTDHTLVRWKP
jgi:hypothetical protein